MKTFSLALALMLYGLTGSWRDTSRSVREGVFSPAQADRGARIFKRACLTCHQPEQFKGPAYMDSWTGQSAHAFYLLIRNTMPQENPGSLKKRHYADILAYLFRLNAMPAGETELKGDAGTLRAIRIEGPYEPNGSNQW